MLRNSGGRTNAISSNLVSHSRNKQQAYLESRNKTIVKELFGNLALLWGGKPEPKPKPKPEDTRSRTWNGVDLEAQGGGAPDSAETPIFRASSAPAPTLLSGWGRDEEKERERLGTVAEGGLDQEAREAERNPAEQRSNDTGVESQQSTLATSSDAPITAPRRRLTRQTTTIASSDGGDKNAAADEGTSRLAFFKDSKRPAEPFTVANQLRRTIFGSWVNILLLAVPVGIALNYVSGVDRTAVFVVNFLAIIPLAAMLSSATEEISLRTGETLGGLLNATFGNAVELIVAIMALVKGEVLIVQTSLLGSILSNLLLVMGMCFFFGGVNRIQQHFNTTVAQTAASLLSLALAGVIVPTVFDAVTSVDVAPLSRGTAIILLFVYGAYLLFQLKTHSDVFAEESEKAPTREFGHHHHLREGAIAQGLVRPAGLMGAHGLSVKGNDEIRDRLTTPPKPEGREEEEDDDDSPKLQFWVAFLQLCCCTALIALNANYMVDAISAVTANGVSQEFVGLILLPIVGNAAEHVTAVTVAMKDKMDLAIGVAVGSSMQVALLLIPLLVIIGWGMGMDDMTLSFDIFQVAVMFVAVLLVNYLIADGKSHWLEGMLLMCLYLIIAVCSWYYPAVGVV